MLPDPFTTEDGDVILRADTGDSFRVHKVVLSLASPLFKQIFRAPPLHQPDHGQGGLPIFRITHPPEIVDLLLRFIYPGVVPPTITDPATLRSLLAIAASYGVPTVLPVVKEWLADEETLEVDPFGVYIVAYRWGFTEIAMKAARGLTFPKLKDSPSSRNPQFVIEDDYHYLLQFLKDRGEKGKRTIREFFSWDTDPPTRVPPRRLFPCGHEMHSGLEVMAFYNDLAERIAVSFELDPRLDVERMVEIFVNGPKPPSNGFCVELEGAGQMSPPPGGHSVICPTHPFRMMVFLRDLALQLDKEFKLYFDRALEGAPPY